MYVCSTLYMYMYTCYGLWHNFKHNRWWLWGSEHSIIGKHIVPVPTYRCCRRHNYEGDIERRWHDIDERRRNFEQQQRHERLARQELIQSILRQLQELHLDLRVQIPLGEEETQRLPVRNYDAKSELSDTCAICVDEFAEEDQVRVLPCNHIFHPQCIGEWLGNHSSLCPLCKKEVPRQGRRDARNGTDTSDDDDDSASLSSLASDRDLLLPRGQREADQQVLYGSI